jgi:hypothetical protein
MAEQAGWLRAAVVNGVDPPWQAEFSRMVPCARMVDPDGNEFTVVLPLPPDVARTAYGPKGTPG